MTTRFCTALAVTAIFFVASSAHAARIHYQYEGVVTRVWENQNSVLPTVVVGTPFSGSFWYDDAIANQGNGAYHQRAFIEAELGGVRHHFFGDHIWVWYRSSFTPGGLHYGVDPPGTVTIDSGDYQYGAFDILIQGPMGAAEGQNTLPTWINLDAATTRQFRLAGTPAGSTDRFSLEGELTSIRRIATAGDLSADGKRDIVVRRGAKVSRWYMNGHQVLALRALPTMHSRYQLRGFGDADADGDTDLVWCDPTTGQARLWRLTQNTVSDSDLLGPARGSSWFVAEVGDLVGDDHAEVLWRHISTGALQMWEIDGPTVLQQTNLPTVSTKWDIAGIADFNNDGDNDVLWQHRRTYALTLWLMRGATLIQQVNLSGGLPRPWIVKGAGHYDGDGVMQILFLNPNTSMVRLAPVNGAIIGPFQPVRTTEGWDIGGGLRLP